MVQVSLNSIFLHVIQDNSQRSPERSLMHLFNAREGYENPIAL